MTFAGTRFRRRRASTVVSGLALAAHRGRGTRPDGPLSRVDRVVHRLHALCLSRLLQRWLQPSTAPRVTGVSRPATTAPTTWPTDSSGTGCPTPGLRRSRGTPPTGGPPSPTHDEQQPGSRRGRLVEHLVLLHGARRLCREGHLVQRDPRLGGQLGRRLPVAPHHPERRAMADRLHPPQGPGASAATTSRAWQVAGPSRVMDTRTGLGVPLARVAAGRAATFQVAGRGGLPSTGVAKVMLNINATSPTTNGYLTVHASGTTQPGSRSASIVAARPNTKAVLSSVGADGKVRIYTSATTDLSVDVVGWSAIGGHLSGERRCACSTPAPDWPRRRRSSRRVARSTSR